MKENYLGKRKLKSLRANHVVRGVQKSTILHISVDVDFAGFILCKTHVRNEGREMTLLGYARVSTDGQSLDAQLAQLKIAECTKIFREKVSGARTERPELRKLLAAIQKGDIVIVTRLDRLARSTRDLLNVLAAIAERGGTFRSLADAWADTTTPHGRLMLTVLGGLAEFERDLIKTRTSEGRARAKARGVKLGRRPKLSPHQIREAIARRDSGETLTEIARTFNVSHSTISRI
jgi:DNA invertase Pin-like site-specific DNA recombinase